MFFSTSPRRWFLAHGPSGRVPNIGFAWVLVVVSSTSAWADSAVPQRIQFDIGNVVSCRDITASRPLPHDANERILAARFQISVLSQTAPGKEIGELLLRIESPDQSLQIADYFPKTTLASDFIGPVHVEQHREQKQSLEFNLGARSATAQTGVSALQQSQDKYLTQGQQLPPLVLCAASGTILRSHGVYFKLCPTTRTSLEGSHEFTLWLQVPASWRADILLVSCEAFGFSANVLGVSGSRVRLTGKSFLVAAHLEGDKIAKNRAIGLVRAERELRDTVVANQKQLKKIASPDPFRDLESLFKGSDRRLPENWLEQAIFSPAHADLAFAEKLPTVVRTATLNFRDTKRQILRLNSASIAPTRSSTDEALPNSTPVGYSAELTEQPSRLPPVES